MRLSWVCGLMMLVVSVSCQQKVEQVRISRVLLNGGPQLDRTPQVREEIRSNLETFLAGESSVDFNVLRDEATHRLKVRVQAPSAEATQRGLPGWRVMVSLADRADSLPARVAIGHGGDTPEKARAVLTGFRDAWAQITQLRRIDPEDVAGLLELVGSQEPHLRGYALDCLAFKRVSAAVPKLAERLATETDPDTLMRLVGALAEIGDERAVRPLIELTRRKDDYFVLQVIHAVGAIGGRTAEGFLVTMASGHGSEHVRQVAKTILNEYGAEKVPAQ